MMMLFADLIMNFSILFTLTLMMYLFTQKEQFLLFPKLKPFQPVTVGLLGASFGIILMLQHISAETAVIMDARFAAIIFSGLFGGPVAMAIATTAIAVFRFLYFGMGIEHFVAAFNTLVFGYVVAVATLKNPMTLKNSIGYYSYGIVQTATIIYWYNFNTPGSFLDFLLFLIYSSLSYVVVWFTLKRLNRLTKEIEKIEHLSKTDYLTGLNNNRRYQEIFYEWRNLREGFHLAVIDIDHFKRVNDTHGHPIGDLVLIELSKRLEKEATRMGGEVSRIGGEEFGALLPATTRKEAFQQAERLRKVIGSKPFILPEELKLKVTVSIGMAQYPGDGQSLPDLYKLADEKLYDAKLGGRNRVCITKEPPLNRN